MIVQFKHWACAIEFGSYANGRLAITLKDTNAEAWDPSPVAVATVNIPGHAVAQDEVIIKDYSENAGMAKALEEAGVITRHQKFVPTGFVVAEVCRLTERAMNLANKAPIIRP
jgi:hypothetical protein